MPWDMDTSAAQAAALAGFSTPQRKVKAIQNPLTPGQLATGQASQYDQKRPDDAAQTAQSAGLGAGVQTTQEAAGLSTPTPNIPGIATGKGGLVAAQEAAAQQAGGLGLVNPSPSPKAVTYAGNKAMAPKSDIGLATTPGLNMAPAAAVASSQPDTTTPATGATSTTTPATTTTPGVLPETPPADQGWTQQTWDLYRKLMSDPGMSAEEKAAGVAQLNAIREQQLEQANYATGKSGGDSAWEAVSGAQAGLAYQQGLQSLDKQAYDRQMAAMQDAARLAQTAQQVDLTRSHTWDDTVKYFGAKGITLNSDGTLTDANGKKIDESTLSAADRQAYESFLNNAGKTNPYAPVTKTDTEKAADRQKQLDSLLQTKYGVTFTDIENGLKGKGSGSSSGYFKDKDGNYHSLDELGGEWRDVINKSGAGTAANTDLTTYVHDQLVKLAPTPMEMGGGGSTRNPAANDLINQVVLFIKQNSRPPNGPELAKMFNDRGLDVPDTLRDAKPARTRQIPTPDGKGMMEVPMYDFAFEL